jgi:hypothetical protein
MMPHDYRPAYNSRNGVFTLPVDRLLRNTGREANIMKWLTVAVLLFSFVYLVDALIHPEKY